MAAALSGFIEGNRRASRRFNTLFPGRRDPMPFFAPLVRDLVRPGSATVDIGGGRHPLFSPAEKRATGLTVTGVDISRDELELAPAGAYDMVVVGNAEHMVDVPASSADVVYSRAVAEHLQRPESMFAETFRVLRPGGHSVHYIPNRWALFALVNASLPPKVSRKLLYTTRPGVEEWAGFTSYYRQTTPRSMRRMFERIGFQDIWVHAYHHAEYLDFLLPAHVLYVMWQNVGRWMSLEGTCESFVICGRKP